MFVDLSDIDLDEDIIKISEFNTPLLNVIFGWCEKYLSTNVIQNLQSNEIDFKLFYETTLNFWEILWFENATKTWIIDIFSIVRAADFYDIPPLIQSLSIFVGREFQQRSNEYVYKNLFDNSEYLPHRFAEKCLYQVLDQKQNLKAMNTNFVTRRFVDSIFKVENCVNCYNRKWLCFDDYIYISLLHGNHIRFDHENKFIKINLVYKHCKLNLNQLSNIRNIMECYLTQEDLNTAIIAGGIFWDYMMESPFAKYFPDMFKILSEKKDIDIIISDDISKRKLKLYYENIIVPKWDQNKVQFSKNAVTSLKNVRTNNFFESIQDSENIYDGVHSFKVLHSNGQIINFIFINKEEFASPLLFIDTFDFSIAKTYYSYESDSLYLPIEIFNETERMGVKFEKSIAPEDVYSTVTHEKFQKYYRVLKEMLEFDIDPDRYIRSCTTSVNLESYETLKEIYINKRKTLFLVNYRHQLNFLGTCRKIIYRIFKYGFKNNFKNLEECHKALEPIKHFYNVFKKEIEENNLNNCNMTDSIFNYKLIQKIKNL